MTNRQLLSARVVKLWLDIAFFAGGILAVALTAWLVFSPLAASRSTMPFEVDLPVAIGEYPIGPLRSVLPLEVGPNSPTAIERPRIVDGAGELRFDTGSPLLHFAVTTVWVLTILVVLFVVFLLRRIFQTVIAGEALSLANAARLRAIAVIIVVAGLLGPLVEYLVAAAVLSRVAIEGVPLNPPLHFRFDVVLTGLMILALSTVFTHGAQLEHDQSLTV